MRTKTLAFSSVLFTAVISSACAGRTPRAVPASAAAPRATLAETGIEPSWMDPTIDPCTDYFAYACGGFVKTTEIPPDRASWGTTAAIEKSNEEYLRGVLEKAAGAGSSSDPVTKKIGDYYAACMDEAGIEKAGTTPIQHLLAEVTKVKDFPTLTTAIAKLHAENVFPLFDLSSRQDFKDATHMIAMLDQDGIGLPDRDYFLKDEGNLKEVREFYTEHVSRMLKLLGWAPTEIKAATADVLRIETKIAKLEQDKVTRRDPYKVYHRVDRVGLSKAAPTFPWNAYFKEMGIPDATEIAVNDPAYFTGIDSLLHDEAALVWRHYLGWQVVRAHASILTKAFVDERFTLEQKLSGQKELPPRWKRCVRSTDEQLGELLAQPYVAAKFAGDSKRRAQELVQWIRDAMRTDLNLLPWMDEQTRAAALAKLSTMKDKVGYPDKWRAYDFEVSRTAYAKNAMTADRFESRRQLDKIGRPVDKTEWSMTPPTVNAYYDASLNEIVLPAGELQPPFFSKSFYAPVNIGDEGANTIGHEITHAFDDEGSQFDGAGNLRDWWTKETKNKFETATKCVQHQYSQYEAVPGVKLNGELTSGENIADIGGVKLGLAALAAWQKGHPNERRTVEGFSDEQLFFLAYAQGWCSKETPQYLETLARTNPHSPPRWRVNGPMSDTDAFAKSYQCKAGTPMNSGKTCTVW
jgi:putative endopeptidase